MQTKEPLIPPSRNVLKLTGAFMAKLKTPRNLIPGSNREFCSGETTAIIFQFLYRGNQEISIFTFLNWSLELSWFAWSRPFPLPFWNYIYKENFYFIAVFNSRWTVGCAKKKIIGTTRADRIPSVEPKWYFLRLTTGLEENHTR